MAPDQAVEIGSFSIASNIAKDFALTVSTSMCLSLPDDFPETVTVADLREQVEAGTLWITRASSCRLVFTVHFEDPADMLGHGYAQRRQIFIEAIQDFPLWCTLGLELRLEHNLLQRSFAPSTTVMYTVHHSLENSSLIAPQDVPCGYLSQLACKFQFAARASRARGSAEEKITPRSRSHIRYNLRNLAERPKTLTPGISAAFWGLPVDLQAERIRRLAHNGLDVMLGLRNKCLGIRHFKRNKPPSLLELAPAVWNAQYFQNVIARAQLVPSVSYALANLTSTQSPFFRQKILSLMPESPLESGFDDISSEIRKRALVLLLRTTQDQKPKVGSPGAKTQKHASASVESRDGCVPTSSGREPTSLVRNSSAYHGSTNYNSLGRVEETLCMESHDQLHEAILGRPEHEPTHSESVSRQGHSTYKASGGSTENVFDEFTLEQDCIDSQMESWETIDDVFIDTLERHEQTHNYLRGSDDPCEEEYAGVEVSSLKYGDEELDELHTAPGDTYDGFFAEYVGFDVERSHHGRYYEMLPPEGKVHATPRALQALLAVPEELTEPLVNTTHEYFGSDFLDHTGHRDPANGDIAHEYHGEDGMGFDRRQTGSWQVNDDYGRDDLSIMGEDEVDRVHRGHTGNMEGHNSVYRVFSSR